MEKVQESFGFSFEIPPKAGKKNQERNRWLRYMILSVVAAIPLLLITFVLPSWSNLDDWLKGPISDGFRLSPHALIGFILATPVQIFVGAPLYKGSYASLRYGKMANMDCLIVLSTTIAYCFSLVVCIIAIAENNPDNELPEVFFETSVFILALISLGRLLEIIAKGRASNILAELLNLQVPTAILVDWETKAGGIIDINFVQKNDFLKVMPGCRIPVDGYLFEGCTDVDESMITGESRPVFKPKLSPLIGGSINQSSLVYMKVTRLVSDSTLSRISQMVEDAQTSKTNIERLADKVAVYFVPCVIVAAVLTTSIWLLVFRYTSFSIEDVSGFNSKTVRESIFFGISVLIISCPCAVALAAPTPVLIGTGVAAKHGIVVKGGVVLESAHKTSAVVFDKTGTLTQGKPAVTDFVVSEKFSAKYSEKEFFTLVASAESGSVHSVAKAIIDYTKEKYEDPKLKKPKKFKAFPKGYGITCEVGKTVTLGNYDCMVDNKIKLDAKVVDAASKFETDGKTVVYCSFDKTLVGAIAVQDTLKKESKFVVNELVRSGIQVWILSGDNVHTTQNIGEQLGLDAQFCLGSLLPEKKTEKIAELQQEGHVVCMIGDGVNDAAALTQADVGVAISEGTDVAIEAADIVLTKNSLVDLLIIFDLSHSTFNHIKINLAWAFGYNLIGIPLASGMFYPLHQVAIPPAIAGVSELLSSIPVVLLSLLLKRYKVPSHLSNNTALEQM
eukprot:TRINITY_DN2267_c0_g1_i1.p1 TRINITY_DN2267_c0_g1~~TRINITY_DN2267_c0_g1_i1.p1  ORF type:complete len:730 (-),score=203.81 TRINITY_DN2267_c0_g1_i1:66-2255(-)